jgi:glycine/D-amino acid oxidase-like deaminating enzyme
MIPNKSPWIEQLKRTRPVAPLSKETHTDVVIVGGGIAGIVSAFFILHYTTYSVVLLEADKIAHGATGHNAGQLTSYFERPFTDIVREFGLAMAIEGQRSVESAWELIEHIVTTTRIKTPLYTFTGYAGFSDYTHVISHLEDNLLRRNGNMDTEPMYIASEWLQHNSLPSLYDGLYTPIPQSEIQEKLETNHPGYIAIIQSKKGCMNSALFSEEIAGYLIATHPERFHLHEGTHVKNIRLHEHSATLTTAGARVFAQRVLLCTNGFENFSITNEHGPDIDTTFHASVAGRIGYMSAYVDAVSSKPTAVSYFPRNHSSNQDPTGETYFYLTRRPHEHTSAGPETLICTGGPEKVLPNGAEYSRHHFFDDDIRESIADFMDIHYKPYAKNINKAFYWHGLMGYTPNGIRRIGAEPCNPILLYNLGCNGVGILPSIYGAKRITQILQGVHLPPSIFDPKNQTEGFL